jgi:hypothetical protein
MPESSKEKRERYISSLKRGAPDAFNEAWEQATAGEPELLVEFFFNHGASVIAFRGNDAAPLQEYIARVLKDRQAELAQARALLRAARCLNNLAASVRYASIVEGLEGIVKAFELMNSDVVNVMTGANRIGPLPAGSAAGNFFGG